MTSILAFDTSSEACSVALFLNGEVRERFELLPRQHTRKLLPMIEELLAEAGVGLSQLDGIGFGAGPGSFTGLRITAGVAQGLALGAELPLLPVSTLAALSEQARQQFGAQRVLAALDARMGELYWGAYEVADNGVQMAEPERVCAPEKVTAPADWLVPAGCVAIGPGWNYRQQLPESIQQAVVRIEADCLPGAGAMARLAARDFSAGKGLAADAAMPVYLRDEVAWQKSNHRD